MEIEMSGNLFVQGDGLRNFSQTHADIAAGLSQLTGAASAAGMETSHGAIASAVSAALGNVLGARDGTIQTTANSGSTISELLQKAAQMYEQGDEKGAAALKAAAEALQGGQGADAPEGSNAPGGPGSATSAAAVGGDMMGQLLGQLGQVGQMAAAAGAPLQALAQPLQQLPQQVMQGVQQAVQKAGQAGEKQVGEKVRDDPKEPVDPNAPGQDTGEPGADEPKHQAQAAPGEPTGTGRAPEPPQVERAEPAQTRPQAD
jgi:hypothetical protein